MLLTKTLALAAIIALAGACTPDGSASNPPQPGSSPSNGPATAIASASAPPTQLQVSPAPASPSSLVRCEDLPDQTFTSDTYRFSIGCPSNFSWQTYGQMAGRLFHARAVDDRYLNGQPAGEVDIVVVANSGNSLRDWVASHTGPPSSDANHLWDSTSNLTDIQIAGRPAIGFDYVIVAPDSPVNFHAAAFVLPEGSVLLIDWWAFSSDYGPAIASIAQQMIAGIQPFGA